MAMQFEVSGIIASNVSLKIEADSEEDAILQFRGLLASGWFSPVEKQRLVESSISVEQLFEVEGE
jgi:hypothetical protein